MPQRRWIPDFAGQRVRLASVVVELADGISVGVRHFSFSILDFDVDWVLNVERFSEHQMARFETMLAGVLKSPTQQASVVEATSRFVARGGTWEPDPHLRRSIEAAAIGVQPCPRVRVVG
jgi:hypothetical protein